MLNKIKILFKRLNEKIKHLNRVIRYVKKQCNKCYIVILFDIIWCYIVYSTDLEEYKKYEFYNIKHDLRKTYLNDFYHNLMRPFIYKKENSIIVNNKDKFLLRFNKYIKSEIKDVNKISFKEFEDTLLKNKKIICRSNNVSFINSYEVYDLKDFRGPGFVLEKAKKNKLCLVEKYIDQHKKLKEITENLVIVNLVTMINKGSVDVISSYITFKDKSEIVKCNIDIKKGKLKGHLRDKNNNVYEDKVYNNEIPNMKEMIDFVKSVALEISEIKEIEWSLCLDNRGKIHLMDACLWKNYLFAQTPEHLNKRVGLLPYYKNVLLKKY